MKKPIVNLTIFLMKTGNSKLSAYLKKSSTIHSVKLKPHYKLDGEIFYTDSSKNIPKWKMLLDELSSDIIDINENTSNKAVLLVRINNRVLAIVFGYGRALLREELIERNFGFRVVLNSIDPNKIRSIDTATIENMVVAVQKQASATTTQDEFGLNILNDIMRGITGVPFDSIMGQHMSGKDSLIVAVAMELSELQDKLIKYLDAYEKDNYKQLGFEWVDNVAEIRDSELLDNLDKELVKAIVNGDTEHLSIAPPETTDWERIKGFCYAGTGKNLKDSSNYLPELDLNDYIKYIKEKGFIEKLLIKLKRDRLYAMDLDDNSISVCSVYAALMFQTQYKKKHYILWSRTWYQIEASFYDRVNGFVNAIKVSDLHLPECPAGYSEAEYNKSVADKNINYCLMDRKLTSVERSHKQIEACDIFTKDKQFIHVKNQTKSSQLSHLFSQGKVSALCFASDESFRNQVAELAALKFGSHPFDYKNSPEKDEYETVYAIIDSKKGTTERLPFFSKVNLMISIQELNRMQFRSSVCFIKRQDPDLL